MTTATTVDLAVATHFCKGAITSAQTLGLSPQATEYLAQLLPGAYATAQAGIEVGKAGISAAVDTAEATMQSVTSATPDNGPALA